jgi:Mrp family chromosome partitioning ATPase
MSSPTTDMFEQLKRNFDIIIIDSPPVGAVGDALILAKYSDVNLFILRQNYSYKSNLEIVNDLLDTRKLSNLHLVMNDIKNRSYKYSYGYYKYGDIKNVNGNGNGRIKQSKKEKMSGGIN